jgi:hypothetical protein
MATSLAGQHHAIKDAQESIGDFLVDEFKKQGYKRVHLVVDPPNSEAIEGKLPGISVYLYNLIYDEEGLAHNLSGSYIDHVMGPDGRAREVSRERPIWLRLDFLISAWAHEPHEEHLLIGAAVKALLENRTISGDKLKGSSWQADDYLPLNITHKLDESILSRFWASINQPMKPAIQCWTTVPIYPAGEVEVRRVQEKDVRFFDLNKLNKVKR